MSNVKTIADDSRPDDRDRAPRLNYLTGFGNEHASEALPDTLPAGQNSPQRVPRGLYAEQLSGTAFTAPRAENRRSWLYRIRPSAVQGAFRRIDDGLIRSAPITESALSPNRHRWAPWPLPEIPTDFIAGLVTVAANGDVEGRAGAAIHVYAVNRSMTDRAFADHDGELLIAPQLGRLLLTTEMGGLDVAPGEIALIPRAVKFRVELLDDAARGFVCENYGAHFRLPELGPIGANGLANPRDFLSPVAAFEDRDVATELVVKFGGGLWMTALGHSPFDVVAWHGNCAPCKYDLARFNAMNSVSFDHPDPSIFTVLTSPSGLPGTANVDFVIFPPRWTVTDHTFRPPWFHRNVMSEYVAAIHGMPEARAGGYPAGTSHLHNSLTPHGPDPAVVKRASTVDLGPTREESLVIMFETRLAFRPTKAALQSSALESHYDRIWDDLPKLFHP